MKNVLRILFMPLIALMIAIPIAGCSPATQSQITTAVTDIQKWAPVVTADVAALSSDIASFVPSDAAAINSFVATLQADAPQLQALCQAYLAAPSNSTLSQLSALIASLATTNSQALLNILNIKSTNSQTIAKGVLTTLATAFTILVTLTANWQTTSQLRLVNEGNPVKLAQLRPVLDRTMLSQALSQAQAQGMVARSTTVDGMLDRAQAIGL